MAAGDHEATTVAWTRPRHRTDSPFPTYKISPQVLQGRPFFKGWSRPWLPPNFDEGGKYSKDSPHNPFRPIWISSHAVWVENAAQTFQRLMDTVCRKLDFVFVYLDDILVASKDEAEHWMHLKELFQHLERHRLVNLNKCQFNENELYFFRHRINQNGAMPHQGKIKAIANFPKPNQRADCVLGYSKLLPSFYAKSCRNHGITLIRNLR